MIQTNYGSDDDLRGLLDEYNVHIVICTFAMDFADASDAQLSLIRAADRAVSVKRFIPSEFNVDYDLGDDALPYPDKRFHAVARRQLEKTSLEYTYIYPGMFSDYFGMPHVSTHLRELSLLADPESGLAYLPDDGNAKMATCYTRDVAWYTALALELEKWPRVLTVASSTVTPNQLVALIDKSLGRKLKVTYQPIEQLKDRSATLLPRLEQLASQFPGGIDQVKGLKGDLEASIALGAYDFTDLKDDHLDLVEFFKGKTDPPKTIEELITVWKDH